MIGRIVRSVDFERVLGSPIRARSAHFAVHYLASAPSLPKTPQPRVGQPKLSTGRAPQEGSSVDDLTPSGRWLGTVVPKRHARRSVTRTLLKRQIRQAALAQTGLAQGLWVVRLRMPFDRSVFVSAASDALRACAGEELATVLAEAARRVPH